jgi:hypothetical protein
MERSRGAVAVANRGMPDRQSATAPAQGERAPAPIRLQHDERRFALRMELGTDARAIATGGLADLIYPHASTIECVDPFLTLEGLRLVWERNR